MTKPDFDLRDNFRIADELEKFAKKNQWGGEAEELLTSAVYALRRTTRHLNFWLTKHYQNSKQG